VGTQFLFAARTLTQSSLLLHCCNRNNNFLIKKLATLPVFDTQMCSEQSKLRRKKASKMSVSKRNRNTWTEEMDNALTQAVLKYGEKNWKQIASEVEGRNHVQCLQRWKKCINPTLVKGHWSPTEDAKLLANIRKSPMPIRWSEIAKGVAGRSPKQCRERWYCNLNPEINKGPWTEEEDDQLLQLHEKFGNRWTKLSAVLKGRTENMIKGRYKSLIRAREKLWTVDEDAVVIFCKCFHKQKWQTVVSSLSGRSKHAVKKRWKYLVSIDPNLSLPDQIKSKKQAHQRAVILAQLAEAGRDKGVIEIEGNQYERGKKRGRSTPSESSSSNKMWDGRRNSLNFFMMAHAEDPSYSSRNDITSVSAIPNLPLVSNFSYPRDPGLDHTVEGMLHDDKELNELLWQVDNEYKEKFPKENSSLRIAQFPVLSQKQGQKNSFGEETSHAGALSYANTLDKKPRLRVFPNNPIPSDVYPAYNQNVTKATSNLPHYSYKEDNAYFG